MADIGPDGLWLAARLEANPLQCRAERVRHRADTIYQLTMGGRVIAIQTGFAMLEAAYGRPIDASSIMMKNSMDLVLGVFAYYFLGWWLSFGHDAMWVEENAFDFALWFLQFSYATTAGTINSGALAGRVSFVAYLILSILLTGVIYPVCVHWVWGGGWLSSLGFVDFAGSSLVHMVGATSALVSVCMCGPRIGRYPNYQCWSGLWRYVFSERNDSSWYQYPKSELERAVYTPIKACNNPVQCLFGTFLLLTGFLAFNPASTLNTTYDTDLTAARTTVTTLIAASGGAVSSMMWSLIARQNLKLRVPEMTNSVLGGLVASCACCHVVPPLFMAMVGFVGGLLTSVTAPIMDRFQLDDTVGAVSVHGPPAIWGVLCVALFAQPNCQSDIRGLFFGGGEAAWILLLVQICGIVSLAAFAAAATWVSVSVIDLVIGFRCHRAHEIIGLDFTEHEIDNDSLRHDAKERLLRKPATPTEDGENLGSSEAPPDSVEGSAGLDSDPSTVALDEACERVGSSTEQKHAAGHGRGSAEEHNCLKQEVAQLKEDVLELVGAISHLARDLREETSSAQGLNIIGAGMDWRYHGQNREHALQQLMQEAGSARRISS